MTRALACALTLVLGGGVLSAGCTKKSGEEHGAAIAGGSPVPERILAPSGEQLGAHPGHLRDAFVYASIEPRALHALVLELPLEPDLRGELETSGRELGVELVSPQLLDTLRVSPEATLSMSARLVDTGRAELERELGESSARLLELRPSDTEAPLLSADAQALVHTAGALGVHLRLHLPVTAFEPARRLAASIASPRPEPRGWSKACEQAAPHLLCEGQEQGVFVLRELPGALQLDVLLPFIREPETGERTRALLTALRADADTPTVLAGLRGQLGLMIDGPGTTELLQAAAIARTIEAIAKGRDRDEQLQLERHEALGRLHETERLFEGITIEGELGASDLVLRARWLPAPEAEARLPEILALSEIDADVPSLSALCSGALVCARSRGVPKRERFASLARGIYSRPDQLGSALDRFQADAALILALETWPNLIASSTMLPGTYVSTGQAMMINNAIGVLSRVLGFGLSIRSLDQRGGEYVAYARTSSVDLDSLVGMLELAELHPARTKIEGVPSRQLRVAALPGRELAGNFYALDDPDEGAGAWGWALAADADARVHWLSGLEHDEGAAPLVYAEVSDLWRLLASFDHLPDELDFARSWLDQRWVRAQLSLGPGARPELRAAMGRPG